LRNADMADACQTKLVLLLLASCGLACEAVRESVEKLTAAELRAETGELAVQPRAKNVAILGDYDGCFDLISPTNKEAPSLVKKYPALKKAKDDLNKYLEEITKGADNVTLFIGSNRQSNEVDEFNAKSDDRVSNGLCRTGFRQLADERKWNFNDMRLQEKYEQENEGIDAQQRVTALGKTAGMTKEEELESWSVAVKKEMADLHLKNLLRMGQRGAEVYFFDDVQEYLDAVCEEVFLRYKDSFTTYIVRFSWYHMAIDGARLTWKKCGE